MTKSGFRNARLEVLHDTAAALHRVGALDQTTMRDLDAFCLTKVGEEALRMRPGRFAGLRPKRRR